MIQRVQSIYLVLCILCLASLLFGVNIIHFEGPEYHYSINALTIETFEKSSAKVISSSYHYGLAILLVLLLSALVTLLHFKNIKKQFKLGRTLFFTYFLCLVGAVIWLSFGDGWIDEDIHKSQLGFGFILFVIGFPFTFLANLGIKRDKTLLDSLDRLR